MYVRMYAYLLILQIPADDAYTADTWHQYMLYSCAACTLYRIGMLRNRITYSICIHTCRIRTAYAYIVCSCGILCRAHIRMRSTATLTRVRSPHKMLIRRYMSSTLSSGILAMQMYTVCCTTACMIRMRMQRSTNNAWYIYIYYIYMYIMHYHVSGQPPKILLTVFCFSTNICGHLPARHLTISAYIPVILSGNVIQIHVHIENTTPTSDHHAHWHLCYTHYRCRSLARQPASGGWRLLYISSKKKKEM